MIVNVDIEHIHDKYVYLDWNVFKYMKNPRTDRIDLDNEFYRVICTLKKKYRFPTSLAHIKDRLRNYSEEYRNVIEEDFEFAYKVSEGKYISFIEQENGLALVNADIRGAIDEYLKECNEDKKKHIFWDNGWGTAQIDIDKLDSNHPMYEYLKKHNAEFNADNMSEFLEDLYQNIFDDNTKYAALRDWIRTLDINETTFYISNFSEKSMLDILMYKIGPFLLSFNCSDIDELVIKWKDIAKRYFGNGIQEPSMEQLLIQGYALLEMHPLMKKEKLKKNKNTLDNIIRDGNHCYYASEAKYFVTEDEGTRVKALFLYKAYDIKTKIYSMEEFIDKISVC